MESTNETPLTSTTCTLPPIARSRSLTCIQQSSTSDLNDSVQINRSLSSSYIVDDPDAWNDGHDRGDEDDDDSEELRALASGAAGDNEDTDVESEETAEDLFDNNEQTDQSNGQTLPSSSHLHAPLSSSSASVLGRIAAGFSTAVSGGLHPLKRSPRVAPDLPTPRSPSPKEFFWGPVMPGYPTSPLDSSEMKGGGSTMVIRQTVQLEHTQTSNSADGDIGLRQAIPIMPMYLAVVCCLLNIVSPGLGTFVAGVSMTCCSRPQRENIDYSSLLLINIWVAIFQLISSVLFLIGWIWSVIWGFNFITISREFNSKQGDGQTGVRDDTSDRHEGERATDAAGRTSTTRTTALTRTTTTTVSLPDDSATASASPSVSREPPIIVLQEAPVAPHQDGLLDAAAAAIWIERQRTLHDPSRVGARARVSADARTRSSSSAVPMSRRQRLNRRRRQAAAANAAAAAPEPWNDPLTGVLLCPQALEHIVVHSSIVPDSSTSAGPSGVTSTVQTAK